MTPIKQVSTKQVTAFGDDQPFSSPLFCEVVARIDSCKRHVILEPGTISSTILTLLQGRRCSIFVANAAQGLSRLNEKPDDFEILLQEVKILFSDIGTEKLNTVLCWDLLNYLSLPLIKAFTTHLASHMASTGVLHAYIHSADNKMAQYPQRFSLVGEDKVVCMGHDPAVRKTPRYSYSDLDKYAVGLHVERSVLLRNGMQEYLFRVSQS
jgi:hypothetical protein